MVMLWWEEEKTWLLKFTRQCPQGNANYRAKAMGGFEHGARRGSPPSLCTHRMYVPVRGKNGEWDVRQAAS